MPLPCRLMVPRMGNIGYSGLPTSALFPTRGGRTGSLSVALPKPFAALAQFLGRGNWLSDPRYATTGAQRANFDALHEELAVELARL